MNNVAGSTLQGNVFRLGKVVEVHPDGHAVDIVMIPDGARVAGALVMTNHASTNTGRFDLPKPTPGVDKWDPKLTRDRDMLAVVVMTELAPLVLGFVYPQVNQMSFDATEWPGLRVDRHGSDTYHTIEDNGSVMLSHACGSFVKLGIGGRVDLTGKDYDQEWRLARNVDREDEIDARMYLGAGKVTFDAVATGTVDWFCKNNYTITAKEGSITIAAQEENVNVSAGSDVVVSGANIYLN